MDIYIAFAFIVLLCLFFPFILGNGLIVYSFFSKGNTYLLLILGCILSSLIFLDCKPGYGLDLDRYMETTKLMSEIHSIKDWNFFYATSPAMNYEKNSYLFFAIQFLVSRCNAFNLLSVISSALCGFFLMFPFLNLSKKFNKNNLWCMLLGFSAYALVGYGSNMAETMRWAIAISCTGFVDYIYFYLLKKNIKYIWLLFIPLFFHIGSVLIVFVSLYMALVKRMNIYKFIFIMLCVGIFFYLLPQNTFDSNSALGQITNMATTYSTDFMAGTGNMNRLITQYIGDITSGLIIFASIAFFGYKKNKNNLINIGYLLLAAEIMVISKSLIFERFLYITAFFFLLNIAINIDYLIKRPKIGIFEYLLLIIIIFLCLTRGYIGFRIYDFTTSTNEAVLFTSIFSLIQLMPK